LSKFGCCKLKRTFFLLSLFLLTGLFNLNQINSAYAESAKEIDVGTDEALKKFYKEMPGGQGFINGAKGILVFPQVIKAGFGIGGEYGEGALRINNKTVDYYSTIAASFGFQFGAQAKTVLLAFMEQKALDDFRTSEGWKAGVDGSVALITIGAGDSLDTVSVKDPIIAFVFGQKGLMYNLTLEGSKFTKLKK
jgi:lipid-binding SYLF domain-containing protein